MKIVIKTHTIRHNTLSVGAGKDEGKTQTQPRSIYRLTPVHVIFNKSRFTKVKKQEKTIMIMIVIEITNRNCWQRLSEHWVNICRRFLF